MIDFRYHLVSIIAIFLALALGLVVGASALRGSVTEQLRNQGARLNQENQELRAQKRATDQVNTYNGQVMATIAGQVVADRLKGESVVFVGAPGADEQMRAQTADMVNKAGARISGYVALQDKYLDPNQLTVLSQLTDRLKPAGVTFPADATPYERTALELAAALVTKQAGRPGQDDPAAGQVLSGFKAAGFLNYSGQPATRATLAVVLAPSAAAKGKDAEARNKALVALPIALYRYGNGTVAVGDADSAAEGGMLSALRDEDEAKGNLSTVDMADHRSGQLATVFALSDAKEGKAGDYGTGSEADGPLPTPGPAVSRKR